MNTEVDYEITMKNGDKHFIPGGMVNRLYGDLQVYENNGGQTETGDSLKVFSHLKDTQGKALSIEVSSIASIKELPPSKDHGNFLA